MARKQLPGFIFYPDDFYGSETVQCMSWEAQGIYLWLLSQQSRQGSIPADLGKLARMARMDSAKFEALWSEEIAPCFEPLDSDPSRLVNPKMAGILAERTAYQEQQASNGKKGGRPSKGGRGNPSESDGKPTGNPSLSGGKPVVKVYNPIQSNPIQAPTEQLTDAPPAAVAPIEISLGTVGFGKAARQRTIAAERLRGWDFTEADIGDWCAHLATQAPRLDPAKIIGWTIKERPRVEKAIGEARKWRDERAGPGSVLEFRVREA